MEMQHLVNFCNFACGDFFFFFLLVGIESCPSIKEPVGTQELQISTHEDSGKVNKTSGGSKIIILGS